MEEGQSVDILLIESNSYEAELSARVLRRHLSNPIRLAKSGPQALALLYGSNGAYPYVPQIIILDAHVHLAEVEDLVARFRAEPSTRSVPVIVLTSSEAENERLAARMGNACAFVVKPLDLTKLLDVLLQVQVHWVLLTESPTLTTNFATPQPAQVNR